MSNMKSIFKVAEVGSVIKTDLQTKIFTPVYYRIDVLHTCFYKSNCHQKKKNNQGLPSVAFVHVSLLYAI